MSAAYQQVASNESAFFAAREKFGALEGHMRSSVAMGMTHGEVESYVVEKTRDIARDLLQGHLHLRGAAERPVRVIGSDGVQRVQRRRSFRVLRSVVGNVEVPRLLYQAPGVAGLSPQDASLSLAEDSFSMGVRRQVAEEAGRGSFDEVVERVAATTGGHVAKRQVEQLAQASVVDFTEFYTSQTWEPDDADSLLVLSFDGAGIIMRLESLRLETRRAADKKAEEPKAWPERTGSGEKPNAKRMAEVATVYSVAPYVRDADDIMGELRSLRVVRAADRPPRPRPRNKRVWASVDKEIAEVIDEGFLEALRRDPDQQRHWVVLVDGDERQLRAIQAAARRHRVKLTIVCDFIHVMEYLWKAAYCFYEPATEEARTWVCQHARMLLEGVDPSHVAAGMRRSATLRDLKSRKAVDTCARYIRKRRAYVRYGDALALGLPIASGAIEGACRHLVRDRLDRCGARWSVAGAEAVLKLRALTSSGDFDAYWDFHLGQEHQRNHVSAYAQGRVPSPITLPRLRRAK